MRLFFRRLWARIVFQYQTRRDVVERGVSAVGLAALSQVLYQARPAYPSDWLPFILIALFCAALYNTTLGYFLAVALAMWPLWTLSPYLASLFLAVAVLAQSPILRRLPWTLLITATPMLAWNLISGIGPLMAGMTLGPGGGFWVGALSALWLKVAGGMAGHSTGLLALHQQPIFFNAISARYTGQNSLDTLKLIVEPFNTGRSSLLLLDVLQVLLWGLAGALVGWLRRQLWAERRPWLNLIVSLLAGALLIWFSIFALPIWLQLGPLALLWSDPWLSLGILAAALIAGATYAARYILNRPARRSKMRILPVKFQPSSVGGAESDPASQTVTANPSISNDKDDDVIMLELD
ncbi:MAG: hypothetical protein HYZ49_17020 [Chloroflexi bacterium]|nr:hypothetical protein [Chloroflexota bacterium]